MAAVAPTHLAHYTIVERIGSGASSDVYHAIEENSFVSVAIKQLRPTRQSEEFRRLLTNEVKLAGRLRHPNIVRIRSADFAEETGPFVVMEYVKGEPLSRHEHPDTLLPLATVVNIAEQVGRALQYVAGQGIVHRDVKPENIILMPDGRAKLTDFGCAVAAGSIGDPIAGSLAYMPPEQLEGKPLDERADIYALGAVLYRLLTGRNSFDADNEFDARISILNFPAIPIERHRKGLPAGLVRVTERALAKDLRLRQANWGEFLRELGEAAHEIRMSGYDYDLYRGFSPSTQSVLSGYMAADREFSRSGFSRSMMPESFGEA